MISAISMKSFSDELQKLANATADAAAEGAKTVAKGLTSREKKLMALAAVGTLGGGALLHRGVKDIQMAEQMRRSGYSY